MDTNKPNAADAATTAAASAALGSLVSICGSFCIVPYRQLIHQECPGTAASFLSPRALVKQLDRSGAADLSGSSLLFAE
jgi:hypothetical protein